MTRELGNIQAAYPRFTVTIVPGRDGPAFEAVRRAPAEGLYAVITADPREMRQALATSVRPPDLAPAVRTR